MTSSPRMILAPDGYMTAGLAPVPPSSPGPVPVFTGGPIVRFLLYCSLSFKVEDGTDTGLTLSCRTAKADVPGKITFRVGVLPSAVSLLGTNVLAVDPDPDGISTSCFSLSVGGRLIRSPDTV